MKKLIKFIKKYLPDFLILIGVWIISYGLLLTTKTYYGGRQETFVKPEDKWKILGIMLIAIGIDIIIRRYIVRKKK